MRLPTRAWPVAAALFLAAVFQQPWLDARAGSTAPQPTPTAWAASPVTDVLGLDQVDAYRIEDVFRCGGTANVCMRQEPDALVLARIAIGEAPNSPNDQLYIMWLIKLRTYLGFKNAGSTIGWWCGDPTSGHWCYIPGFWGKPTTVKREALCDGGCQFSPARAADDYYYPCLIDPSLPLRKMLCPTDAQLPDFDFAVRAAGWVLAQPLEAFPAPLRGYDNFRSPTIVGEGQRIRAGGLLSKEFWPQGNIWRDEFPDDNYFWQRLAEPGLRPPPNLFGPTNTATPARSPTPTAPARNP